MWVVPQLAGGRISILASGPSMNAGAAAQVKAAGIPAIAVNNTFRLAPWAWMLYGADFEWWQYTRDAKGFAGLKASCSEVPSVHHLRPTGKEGFDPTPGCIRTGMNSGYQAIHIAAQAGAKQILLLGMDMDGGHWHPEHHAPLRTTHPDTYAVMVRHFDTLAPALEAMGVSVINCSVTSKITAFPKMPLEQALGQNQ